MIELLIEAMKYFAGMGFLLVGLGLARAAFLLWRRPSAYDEVRHALSGDDGKASPLVSDGGPKSRRASDVAIQYLFGRRKP